ncbi:MAG: zinc-ribbon domain-containing protein [Candidatus Aminicenantes bacterium]|nr:MAG: zinc-ribbon domain-containing protein [Candidatus Aminicenantes bacterium]
MAIKCLKCDSENTDTARFCSNCGSPLEPSKDIEVTKTLETPNEQLTTGSTLASRYQIIEELGKGGMGTVYKVHDSEIKENVALKLLKPELEE